MDGIYTKTNFSPLKSLGDFNWLVSVTVRKWQRSMVSVSSSPVYQYLDKPSQGRVQLHYGNWKGSFSFPRESTFSFVSINPKLDSFFHLEIMYVKRIEDKTLFWSLTLVSWWFFDEPFTLQVFLSFMIHHVATSVPFKFSAVFFFLWALAVYRVRMRLSLSLYNTTSCRTVKK